MQTNYKVKVLEFVGAKITRNREIIENFVVCPPEVLWLSLSSTNCKLIAKAKVSEFVDAKN